MPFAGGQPPGPHAGDMSSLTKALRPDIELTPEQCETARRLRRAGRDVAVIAMRLGAAEEEVRPALATMRTRKQAATRRSLNVTLAAHEFVRGEAAEGEACWETVDRLLGELTMRRAFAMVSITRDQP